MDGLIFGILRCPKVSGNVQGKSAEMWERGCVSVEKIALILVRLASLAQTGELARRLWRKRWKMPHVCEEEIERKNRTTD